MPPSQFKATDFKLVPCGVSGKPEIELGPLPALIEQHCSGMREFLAVTGFTRPWVGYVAVFAAQPVGGGAFVGPPKAGEVEIAYYTLPERCGEGMATRTAAALVQIARSAAPSVSVIAHTLPAEGASTRILEKLGFARAGEAVDVDEGVVWRWRLA